MLRDLLHACRAIGRMRATAAVIVLSLGIGVAVNVVVFSWLRTMIAKPIAGVRDAGSFYLVEPRTDAGLYPGASWPDYRRPRAPGDLAAGTGRLPHGAAVHRRRRPGRARQRPVGVRQLLRGAGTPPCARPVTATRGRVAAGGRGGRGHLVRPVAHALRAIGGGAGPAAARQRRQPDHRRRGAARLQGHDPDAELRRLGAGDDGAAAGVGQPGADRPVEPRLHRVRPDRRAAQRAARPPPTLPRR